jgi:hypothetical protein
MFLMQLIYNGFIAIALTTVPVAALAQTAPSPSTSDTVQQTVPDEPVAAPPNAPAQNSAEPAPSPAAAGQSQKPTAATAADVKAGAAVSDQDGGTVGKIDSVSGTQAVVDTGTVRAKVPISSFAKNDKGLVISMTKAELEAAAKAPPK